MINNTRVERLIQYVNGVKENYNGKELYMKYREDIEAVNPQEAFEIFNSLIEDDIDPSEVLVFLDKVINVFYKSLSNYSWERPKNDNFLLDLQLENNALIQKTDKIKELIKEQDLSEIERKRILLPKVEELLEFDAHYIKKENILFPYLEKANPRFNGVKIMWALHDLVRKEIRNNIDILSSDITTNEEVNKGLGNLFFGILGILKKEELILFPAASEALNQQDWYYMHKQSLEYDFPFIEKKKTIDNEDMEEIKTATEELKFQSETGELDFNQILMIFNTLPVDITFVDENNKVKFFSNSKDRLFPRSPAIIGRDVKNCHPPASVHIVEEIVERFRAGKENKASFWINIKGKIFLIQYFALRDKEGRFGGTLEVSQDITDIQKLEGERRLLHWED